MTLLVRSYHSKKNSSLRGENDITSDEKFFKVIWSYSQCHQDLFIFRNLMTHIVCRHYVHMTYIKFLQETNQMNKYELPSRFYYLYRQRSNRFYIIMSSSLKLQNITYLVYGSQLFGLLPFIKAYYAFDDITTL